MRKIQLFCGVRINPLEPLSNFKYDKQFKRYHSYSKKRKRRQVETRVLKRSLLHLLNKLIGLTDVALKQCHGQIKLSPRFHKRYSVIRKVCQRQQLRFEGHVVKSVMMRQRQSF